VPNRDNSSQINVPHRKNQWPADAMRRQVLGDEADRRAKREARSAVE
jgi:hypothetical protein